MDIRKKENQFGTLINFKMERIKCEIFSRVCGYMRPTHSWNEGKQEEFQDREMFSILE